MLVHTMCHHREKAICRPSRVSCQVARTMRSRPPWVRMDSLSIITSASEMANSPMSAGISGTPSNSSRKPNVARGAA